MSHGQSLAYLSLSLPLPLSLFLATPQKPKKTREREKDSSFLPPEWLDLHSIDLQSDNNLHTRVERQQTKKRMATGNEMSCS